MAFKMKGAPYSPPLKQGNGKSMTKTVKPKNSSKRAKGENIDAYYARMKALGHTVNEDGSVTFKK